MFNTFTGDFLVICYTFTGDFLVNYHTFTGDFSCQRYKKAMMMQNFSNQKLHLKPMGSRGGDANQRAITFTALS